MVMVLLVVAAVVAAVVAVVAVAVVVMTDDDTDDHAVLTHLGTELGIRHMFHVIFDGLTCVSGSFGTAA